MTRQIQLTLLIGVFTLNACTYKMEEADLIVHNAKIYSVDGEFNTFQAMAIKDGKVLELGPNQAILNKYNASNSYDAQTRAIYPGFIDGHCHFLAYGLSLTQVNLVGTSSFDEVVECVKAHAEKTSSEWITGRGWDQNDWEVKEFPNKQVLDELFPDRPVLVRRVDGHAALANQSALDLANISSNTLVEGGIVEVVNGKLTGILIDNAVDLVSKVVPAPSEAEIEEALRLAEKECFAVGLTGVHDAGLPTHYVDQIQELQDRGELRMRVYAMLNPDSATEQRMKQGILVSERLVARSVKLYADGALGSRGAKLKSPYSDDPENTGLVLENDAFYQKWAGLCKESGFQLNTHCIGDQANFKLLDLYANSLGGVNDLRWRIEHAQVVTPEDQNYFGQNNILPSVQPTHATSDMYWAVDRLGKERAKGAYAYQDLLAQNGMVILGTDFPVEDISPIKTFFAAVFRKDQKGFPEDGFQSENALTREQTIRGMTFWAAMGSFEEELKGSLEPGKFADFVVLDRDIMTAEEEEVKAASVLATYLGGEEVFKR